MGRLRHSIGPTSYNVALEDGRTVRRHLDHLRPITGSAEMEVREKSSDRIPPEAITNEGYQDSDHCISPDPASYTNDNVSLVSDELPVLRRSKRQHHPPKRYEPESKSY